MPFQTKSCAEIAAIIDGENHPKVPSERRAQLAEKVVAAGHEVTHVLPVMIAHAGDSEETAFLRSLVTEIPPVAQSVATRSKEAGVGKHEAEEPGADQSHV